MKQFITIVCIFISLLGCNKEAATDPLKVLTEKNSAALKNTEWYGLYRNKGEETYGNYTGYRGYALAFGVDSTFIFYSAGLAHNGFWSVKGDTTSFRFATGAQNRWKAIIKSDSLLAYFIQPIPDNFSFDKNMKRIADPPADVIGHTWMENTMGSNPYRLVFTDKSAGVGYPRAVQIDYNRAPVKNKIFNTTDKMFNFSFLIIVDGKTAWTYDQTAYNFQYNY